MARAVSYSYPAPVRGRYCQPYIRPHLSDAPHTPGVISVHAPCFSIVAGWSWIRPQTLLVQEKKQATRDSKILDWNLVQLDE